MSAFLRRAVPPLVAAALLAVASSARADKVLVLDFASSGSGTTSTDLQAAGRVTREAVTRLHHTLPTDPEVNAAKAAVKDGVADTSAEYRAAGRAASSAWTLAGHVDARGGTYRLELEACQVESGRVESLAREVNPQRAPAEVAEMLALLVRPEGIGNTPLPWERAPATSPPASVPPATAVTTPPAPVTPPVTPPPAPAPVDTTPAPVYGEGHPFALGLALGAEGALSRAANARGSSATGVVDASLGYAIAAVRGLELRADVEAGLIGPQSIRLAAGARWVAPILRRARIFVGPEVAVGGFFALGGDRSARVLLEGALPLVWAAADQLQLELVPQITYAGGGSSSLVLGGALVRGAYRF